MDSENHDFNSTPGNWNVSASSNDNNETPTINSTNPNYRPVIDSLVDKSRTESRRDQEHAENIVSKTKKLVQQQWDQARHSLVQIRRKVSQMVPKPAHNLIYWRNPIQSGVVFGVSLSVIITFMFLSSLAAISFWLLAFLVVVGLYKMYNYVMMTFVGRAQSDIFDLMFPSDMSISEQQANDLAHSIRVNGTSLLKHGRNLFLWKNLTNSILFGLILFVFFYIGLSMNALTFALIGLIFIFTVPKIYQVYQVPIDRTAKTVLDQINQLLAKATSKLPNKAKKN
ncbi:unnamed protein product [Rotaria sp. Silwood2]|nr:unnamed protein product [Rotaria sp. Silwood2]CAF2536355.1 unnamed protein product [Rotaria sp. Silwood2]CAF2788579.1 unnamed protein product [Rotaria sp. Silwood2]CAF2941798.1 unnamed protein product [Rotaria sp. Silwood2]CAF3891110.1 unnamed protein product [Rotaria sp. Silwood2]